MFKKLCQMTMIQSRKVDSDNAADLHVIGIGLPRTGTSSLQAALELLGFGPCHHMAELIDKPEQSVQFLRAYDGYEVNFRTLMKGYGSAVGAPVADFYKEIRRVYPRVKIVLTVRDSSEKWLESFDSTLRMVFIGKVFYYVIYLMEVVRLQCLVAQKSADKWTDEFGQIDTHFHDRYNSQIINENNKDEILVYNVKEGWPPLCKFLGVDVPANIPFPNLNEAQHIKRQILLGKLVGSSLWIFVAIVLIVVVCFFNKLIV